MSTRCDEVPIMSVIETLWLQYFHKSWSEYGIYDGWVKTDWRAFNTDKKICKDHTWKWRAEWWPFGMVKSYLKLSDHDTFLRFEEKFLSYKPDNNKPSALSIRKWLHDLDEKCKEYLSQRLIDYDKVKDVVKWYNWAIACMIYNNGMPCGINARTLSSDHKKRFTAYAWLSTNGIYQWSLDQSKDYLYVVEWLIDFLTLRQYESNVVWLKSAESWLDEIVRLARQYKIIMVFDNDEAGKITREKLSMIKYRYFNWNAEGMVDWLKDVNDLHWYCGDLTIKYIDDNLLSDTPIMRTIDKFRERQKILKERWKLGIDWPYKIYDETSWVVAWKVYTIWAFSNTGKSKFAYANATRFMKQWYKILYVSVEESEEDMFGNILATLYEQSINRLWDVPIKEKDFENLVLSDSAKTIKEIDDLVKLHNPDILFIDYAQWLQAKWWSSYEKQASIALWIQQIAIQNKIIVFSLSQLANDTMREMKKWVEAMDTITLKWAGEYYSASDVIFMLTRSEYDDWNLVLSIQKNKLWRRWDMYDMDIVRECNNFTVTKRQSNTNML